MSFKTENARAKTEEIRQLKDLFSLYDNDASGTINKTELKIRDPRTGQFAHRSVRVGAVRLWEVIAHGCAPHRTAWF